MRIYCSEATFSKFSAMHAVSQIPPNPANTHSHPFLLPPRTSPIQDGARHHRRENWSAHPLRSNWVAQSSVTGLERDSHAWYTCPTRRNSGENTSDASSMRWTKGGGMKCRKYRNQWQRSWPQHMRSGNWYINGLTVMQYYMRPWWLINRGTNMFPTTTCSNHSNDASRGSKGEYQFRAFIIKAEPTDWRCCNWAKLTASKHEILDISEVSVLKWSSGNTRMKMTNTGGKLWKEISQGRGKSNSRVDDDKNPS